MQTQGLVNVVSTGRFSGILSDRPTHEVHRWEVERKRSDALNVFRRQVTAGENDPAVL